MITPIRGFVFALAPLLLAAGGAACRTPEARDDRVDRAQTVLARRFESVLSITPSLLPVAKDLAKQLPAPPEQWLSVPFTELPSSMELLGPEAWEAARSSATAVLVGAKDFRAPETVTGLGAVQSTKCFVVVIDATKQVDEQQLFQDRGTRASDQDPWMWTVEVTREGNRFTRAFFALVIDEDFIIVGTDREETIATAGELARSSELRGSDTQRQAFATRDFWGHRKIRPGNPPGTTIEIVPAAESATVFLDRQARKLVLRLESRSAALSLDPASSLPALAMTTPGVFETSIALDGPSVDEQMFEILAIFGFGAYL